MDSKSLKCKINGLLIGLPLASNIFFNAPVEVPFAARPYTVSVGMATRLPASREALAKETSFMIWANIKFLVKVRVGCQWAKLYYFQH